MLNAPLYLAIDFTEELRELRELLIRYHSIVPYQTLRRIVSQLMGYYGKTVGIEYAMCDFSENTFDEYFLQHMMHDELGKDQSIKNIKETLYRTGMYVHLSLMNKYKLYIGDTFPYILDSVPSDYTVLFKRSMNFYSLTPETQLPFSFNK